jgi:hypothetical protein
MSLATKLLNIVQHEKQIHTFCDGFRKVFFVDKICEEVHLIQIQFLLQTRKHIVGGPNKHLEITCLSNDDALLFDAFDSIKDEVMKITETTSILFSRENKSIRAHEKWLTTHVFFIYGIVLLNVDIQYETAKGNVSLLGPVFEINAAENPSFEVIALTIQTSEDIKKVEETFSPEQFRIIEFKSNCGIEISQTDFFLDHKYKRCSREMHFVARAVQQSLLDAAEAPLL